MSQSNKKVDELSPMYNFEIISHGLKTLHVEFYLSERVYATMERLPVESKRRFLAKAVTFKKPIDRIEAFFVVRLNLDFRLFALKCVDFYKAVFAGRMAAKA